MSQKKTLEMEGFYRDENGKWHTVPMKLPEDMKGSTKKSSEKKKPVRKYIPIERLTPHTPDLDISSQNKTKRRKTEKPVRKELFKVPQVKKKEENRSSFNTFSSKSFRFTSNKTTLPKVNRHLLSDGSPLLDIAEADELPQKKCSPIKPIETPRIVVNEATPTENDSIQQNVTPKTDESIKEFLESEKALGALSEKMKFESPMSSVCILLENAKINGSGDSVLDEIKMLIEKDQSNFELLNQQFLKYKQDRQEIYSKIEHLLLKFQDDGNKENRNISKKEDLRKTTLNKNLTKTLQNEVQSPKMKKAINLYNCFRNDCGVLSTPKLDRNALEFQQNSITRSLSRRIQTQCLLLQDTPQQCKR